MPLTIVRHIPYPVELHSFQGFADSSWGNDITDSVVLLAGQRPLIVWIEPPALARRNVDYGWDPESPPSDDNRPPSRFMVCALVDADPDRRYSEKPPSLQQMLDERCLADGSPLFETEDSDALLRFLRAMETDRHDQCGGALCTDDGSGMCRECGVALTVCDDCHGTGYHHAGCKSSDEQS